MYILDRPASISPIQQFLGATRQVYSFYQCLLTCGKEITNTMALTTTFRMQLCHSSHWVTPREVRFYLCVLPTKNRQALWVPLLYYRPLSTTRLVNLLPLRRVLSTLSNEISYCSIGLYFHIRHRERDLDAFLGAVGRPFDISTSRHYTRSIYIYRNRLLYNWTIRRNL